MKAIRIHKHGGPEVLRWEEVPDPVVGPQEVLIDIKASSINHLDIWVRQGLPGLKMPLPLTPGCDGAGVVAGKGESVQDLKPGDKVMVIPNVSCGSCPACVDGWDNLCDHYGILGETCDGCDAERIVLPRRNVIPMPSHLSFEEAATIPLVFMTAWHMLSTKAAIKPEETVLVLAGGSGVGSAAIQIARLHGAHVIATAGSEAKMEKAKGLGADQVINHRKEKISERVKALTDGRGVDVVLDHIGHDTWTESMKSLAKNGKVVCCGATSGPKVNIDLRHLFSKHQAILGSTMGTRGELFEIIHFFHQKKLKPVLDTSFPITELAAAHKYVEEGKQFGKVAITLG